MKVNIRLNRPQRLVLRILGETGSIPFPTLQRVVKAVDFAESDFSAFIRVVADRAREDRFFALDRPKLSELERTVEGLIAVGLIQRPGYTGLARRDTGEKLLLPYGSLSEVAVELTHEGKRVANSIKEERRLVLRPAPERRANVFVACAFGHSDIDMLYDNQLAPACASLGYEPVRVDMTEPKQTITEAILEGITECACAIADLTYARPSVYFEVGFAHGLGVPLLLTCRSDHAHGKNDDVKVHFDLEQYKISFWTRTPRRGIQWPRKMKPSLRLSELVPDLRK
ncbi:MAG: hypothetical protein AB1714_30945 [Acidobacteriota bacterium]